MNYTTNASNKCLFRNFRHIYDFYETKNGVSIWICAICGDWYDEMEDSQP